MQVQFRVTRVHPTGLTVARGVCRCPQGSPWALASAGRRRGQRSNLCGGARWRDGYRVCGSCDGAAGPGRGKTSLLGSKMVPGPSRGGAGREGEETSGSENEDSLGFGRTAWVRTRQSAVAWRGVCGGASLEAADGDHLIPRPNSDGEGAGAAKQDHVVAVVERLKGWNQAAPTDPDKGGGEQLGWQFAGQVGARQGRSRNMQGFGKIFDNGVNWKLIILQKFIWQDNLCPENCLSRGKTSVFPRLCSESEEHKGYSSNHVAAVECARSASLRRQCSLSTAPFNLRW